jgi:hypothetical protein
VPAQALPQNIGINVERLLQQDFTNRVTVEGCHVWGGYQSFQIGDGVAFVKVTDCTFEYAYHSGIFVSPSEGLTGHDWSFVNNLVRNCGQINQTSGPTNEAGINMNVTTNAVGGEVIRLVEFDRCTVVDDQTVKTTYFGFQALNQFNNGGTNYNAAGSTSSPTITSTSIENIRIHDCDFSRVASTGQPISIGASSSVGVTAGPSSPMTIANPLTVGFNVQVTGGAGVSITVNGVSTGSAAGVYFVPGGQSMVITYSTFPTVNVINPLNYIVIKDCKGVTPITGRLQLLNPSAGPNLVVTGGLLGAGIVGPANADTSTNGSWVWAFETVIKVQTSAGTPKLDYAFQDQDGTATTQAVLTAFLSSSAAETVEASNASLTTTSGQYAAARRLHRVIGTNAPKIEIAGTGAFALDCDASLTLIPQTN